MVVCIWSVWNISSRRNFSWISFLNSSFENFLRSHYSTTYGVCFEKWAFINWFLNMRLWLASLWIESELLVYEWVASCESISLQVAIRNDLHTVSSTQMRQNKSINVKIIKITVIIRRIERIYKYLKYRSVIEAPAERYFTEGLLKNFRKLQVKYLIYWNSTLSRMFS